MASPVTSPVTLPVTPSDGAARRWLHVVWLNKNGETPICIANSRIVALGDSGASVSVCSPEFVHQHGLTPLPLRDRLVLRTAAGQRMLVRCVVPVDFSLQGGEYRWYFYLLDPLIQPVILGRDFFSYHNLLLGLPSGGLARGQLPPPMQLGSLATFDSVVPAVADSVVDQFPQLVRGMIPENPHPFGVSADVPSSVRQVAGAEDRAANIVAHISSSTLRLPKRLLDLLEWYSDGLACKREAACLR